MGKDIKNDYTIQLDNERGEIIVSEEVIAVITGLAAMEVEGVASMAGNATRELISKIGKSENCFADKSKPGLVIKLV